MLKIAQEGRYFNPLRSFTNDLFGIKRLAVIDGLVLNGLVIASAIGSMYDMVKTGNINVDFGLAFNSLSSVTFNQVTS